MEPTIRKLIELVIPALIAGACTTMSPGSGCGPFSNCTELRKVHPNGVGSSHCAYQRKHDRDNDGWACET